MINLYVIKTQNSRFVFFFVNLKWFGRLYLIFDKINVQKKQKDLSGLFARFYFILFHICICSAVGFFRLFSCWRDRFFVFFRVWHFVIIVFFTGTLGLVIFLTFVIPPKISLTIGTTAVFFNLCLIEKLRKQSEINVN